MNNYEELFHTNIQNTVSALSQLKNSQVFKIKLGLAIDAILHSYRHGGRLYIAGNGGSAADSQHIAAEFVSKLARDRHPLPGEALTVDTSILTAIGNDYGYNYVFSRQIQGKMTSKDIFLAITTSGNSRNLMEAFKVCQHMSIKTILLGGREGGACKEFCDIALLVPGNETSTIQELHRVVYHTMVGAVEEVLCESL